MANPSLSLKQGDPSTWGLPPVGKTYVGIDLSGNIVTKQNDGTVVIIASGIPGIDVLSSSSGSVTVDPPTSVFSQVINLQGAGRAVPIILAVDQAEEGYVLEMLITMPDQPNYVLTFRNSDSGGTILGVFDNTGSPNILSLNATFKFTSGAWILWSLTGPAY